MVVPPAGDRHLAAARTALLAAVPRHLRRTTPDPSIDLATWSRAAALLIGDRGTLAGYSAAELLGASCAPRRVPAEVVVPDTGFRPRPGLIVHRDALERARFDLAYPAAKLAVEYDGRSSHELRRGADNHRDIDASELGWETMRFQAADVWVTPGRTAGAVARLLEARLPSR